MTMVVVGVAVDRRRDSAHASDVELAFLGDGKGSGHLVVVAAFLTFVAFVACYLRRDEQRKSIHS